MPVHGRCVCVHGCFMPMHGCFVKSFFAKKMLKFDRTHAEHVFRAFSNSHVTMFRVFPNSDRSSQKIVSFWIRIPPSKIDRPVCHQKARNFVSQDVTTETYTPEWTHKLWFGFCPLHASLHESKLKCYRHVSFFKTAMCGVTHGSPNARI